MTEIRKAVLRTVRLDDDVWEAVKGMECSLNQYLREALLDADGARPRRESRKSREVRRLAESDVTAKVADRDDIEYGSEELPTQHVALSVPVREMAPVAQEKRVADWRASRKPIPKPGERK